MISRRTFLQEAGRGVIFVVSYPILSSELYAAARLTPTPSNVEGPFYKSGAPFKMDLREKGDNGISLSVSGSLVDTANKPIVNGLVEIWHTDTSGEYDLKGFRYRSALRTKNDGAYRFETFMPGNYGGRPRHIHYKIAAQGHETLITQLYFEDDPFFEGRIDRTIDKDPIIGHRELIKPVVPVRGREAVAVNFKICLVRT